MTTNVTRYPWQSEGKRIETQADRKDRLYAELKKAKEIIGSGGSESRTKWKANFRHFASFFFAKHEKFFAQAEKEKHIAAQKKFEEEQQKAALERREKIAKQEEEAKAIAEEPALLGILHDEAIAEETAKNSLTSAN